MRAQLRRRQNLITGGQSSGRRWGGQLQYLWCGYVFVHSSDLAYVVAEHWRGLSRACGQIVLDSAKS